MRTHGWIALAAVAALGIPLLNCTDGPTTASNHVGGQGELIVQQITTATDFRSYIGRATAERGAIRDQECERIARAKGWSIGSGLDLGGVAFLQRSPINTSCGCPSQPVQGAPAGYTCTLTSAQCDATGRSCAYTCRPIQKTT
ncbi:MAG: hypothetical protein ACREOG_16270 [Gemmatimonadaceae bacterium]